MDYLTETFRNMKFHLILIGFLMMFVEEVQSTGFRAALQRYKREFHSLDQNFFTAMGLPTTCKSNLDFCYLENAKIIVRLETANRKNKLQRNKLLK